MAVKVVELVHWCPWCGVRPEVTNTSSEICSKCLIDLYANTAWREKESNVELSKMPIGISLLDKVPKPLVSGAE